VTKFLAGKPVQGGPTLRKHIPQKALQLLYDWYGYSEVNQKIDRLNEQYFITDIGTETVVGDEVINHDTREWKSYAFRFFEDFKRKLIKAPDVKVGTNITRDGEKPLFKPLADLWLEHPRGLQYNRLVYTPDGSNIVLGPNDLNGWRGFTVQPAPGSWHRAALSRLPPRASPATPGFGFVRSTEIP